MKLINVFLHSEIISSLLALFPGSRSKRTRNTIQNIESLFQVEFDSLVFINLIAYNQVRPHSTLRYRPLLPEAIMAVITT